MRILDATLDLKVLSLTMSARPTCTVSHLLQTLWVKLCHSQSLSTNNKIQKTTSTSTTITGHQLLSQCLTMVQILEETKFLSKVTTSCLSLRTMTLIIKTIHSVSLRVSGRLELKSLTQLSYIVWPLPTLYQMRPEWKLPLTISNTQMITFHITITDHHRSLTLTQEKVQLKEEQQSQFLETNSNNQKILPVSLEKKSQKEHLWTPIKLNVLLHRQRDQDGSHLQSHMKERGILLKPLNICIMKLQRFTILHLLVDL